MPDNGIQSIVAFQAKDGKQFFTLEETQTYTRRSLYAVTYDRICKEDPNFARLDKELWIDLNMKFGPALSTIALDTLAPKPLPQPAGHPAARPAEVPQGFRPKQPEPTFAQHFRDASPIQRPDPLKTAMRNVEADEADEAAQRAAVAEMERELGIKVG